MKTTKELPITRAPRGLFVGLTTVDIIFAFDKYPEEDTKSMARQYTIAAGGPASNAAVVFSYLGGEAQLVSSLGRSSMAKNARSDLIRHSVKHIDITQTREHDPVLSAIAVAQSNGSRTIFTSPAIDEEFAGPFEKTTASAYVAGADILLLDGHQTKLASCIAHEAKENGVTIILDGDLYQPNMKDFLPLVDIVIFGKSFSVPGKTISEVFKYFESFGIKHVIVTNGEKPIQFVSDRIVGSLQVEEVAAVDTLAAGDFFHGAFCYSYSISRDIHRALKFAARVASRSVTRFGTREWMEEYEPSNFE